MNFVPRGQRSNYSMLTFPHNEGGHEVRLNEVYMPQDNKKTFRANLFFMLFLLCLNTRP